MLEEKFLGRKDVLLTMLQEKYGKEFPDTAVAYKWFSDTLNVINASEATGPLAHVFEKEKSVLRLGNDIVKRLSVGVNGIYVSKYEIEQTDKTQDIFERLAKERDAVVVMKFHPLTRQEWVDEYKTWAEGRSDILYIDKGENVTKYQLMSDVLISDTSSTIYEFLLLSRPVITVGTLSKDIYWENIPTPETLLAAYDHALTDPEAIARRQWIVDNYDPYLDGHVCERMLNAAADYISRHGVPRQRSLNLWRKYTSIKTFGRIKR